MNSLPNNKINTESVHYRGQIYEKKTMYTPVVGKASRVARTVFGTLGQAATLWQSQSINRWAEGGRTGWHENKPEYRPKEDLKFDFDPKNQKALKTYMEGNPKVRQSSSHHYLLLPDQSSFMFAPNGNYDDVQVITLFKSKSGEAIVGQDNLERSVRTYLVAYNTLSKHPDFASFKTIFIDYNTHTIKGFIQDTAKLNPTSIFSTDGKAIDLHENLWKEIDKLNNTGETVSKGKLEGEKVEPPFAGKKEKTGSRTSDPDDNNESSPSQFTSKPPVPKNPPPSRPGSAIKPPPPSKPSPKPVPPKSRAPSKLISVPSRPAMPPPPMPNRISENITRPNKKAPAVPKKPD